MHPQEKWRQMSTQKLVQGTSLEAQWLGLCLPIQGVLVWSLVRELGFHMPCIQKAKRWNRSGIVTNSTKTLEMALIKKKTKNPCMNIYSWIIHSSQKVETIQMTTKWWMDKQKIYPYNRILFSHKRNKVLICTTSWMELENVVVRGRSQPQKPTYCMILSLRNNQSR